jgi:hypothetical protein
MLSPLAFFYLPNEFGLPCGFYRFPLPSLKGAETSTLFSISISISRSSSNSNSKQTYPLGLGKGFSEIIYFFHLHSHHRIEVRCLEFMLSPLAFFYLPNEFGFFSLFCEL